MELQGIKQKVSKLANTEIKTFVGEHAVVIGFLFTVWVCTGLWLGLPFGWDLVLHHWKEAVGSYAVYEAFTCGSISSRMEEREALKAKPDVECAKKFWAHFIRKEIAFALYFGVTGAYSAIAGCVLFALVPVWRKFYRSRLNPLKLDAQENEKPLMTKCTSEVVIT